MDSSPLSPSQNPNPISSLPTFHTTTNNIHNAPTPKPLHLNAVVSTQFQTTTSSPSHNPDFFVTTKPCTDSLFLMTSPDYVLTGARFVLKSEANENVEPTKEMSKALVVALPKENRIVVANTVNKTPKKGPRSGAMVRVCEMDLVTKKLFYLKYRALRMVYDGLRILPMLISGKRGFGTRERRDLKAASIMREKGMWMYRDKRIIGSIPGVSVGDIYFWFIELFVFGLHGQTQAGIDYVCASQSMSGEPIATSIVYSGGYEDDEDFGDVIIYSGHGGKDKLNKQCAHQRLEGGNLALNNSMRYGIELRVIRGIKIDKYGNNKVYVYDGLYKIVESWSEVGKSGYAVFKFKMVREPGQPGLGSAIIKLADKLRSDPLTVRPTGYIHLDMSLEKENFPVRLYNDVDTCSEPLSFEYVSKLVFPANILLQETHQSGCSCVSKCGPNCACTMKNGGEFPYNKNGALLCWKPVIFECGKFCNCPPTCHNRVSQNGIKTHLEVFRLNETSWGVRSLDYIRAGTFICEYSGVVLTKEMVVWFDGLVYPSAFMYKQRIWGDLSTVYPNFKKPACPAIPSIEYAIDVSRYRGVASYIRHSSCPNLMVQPVMHSHGNLAFPHLMIFSMENVTPMKELTLDLGIPGEPGIHAPEILRISN